jgi:hypothetical protein
VEPSIWAIAALLSAVAGVAIFSKRRKMEALAGLASAIAGFISLIVLQIVIKSRLQTAQGDSMFLIETDFQLGYWLSLLAFIIAGGISFLRIIFYKKAIKGNVEASISKLNVFISSSVSNNEANKE